MVMTALERKAAFQTAATMGGKTLNAAAYEACGVTWTHLSNLLADKASASQDVKTKFAAYIGRSVEEVFGSEQTSSAA